MKNISYIEERSKISFPENTGERVYMLEFYQATGLPANLSRWQATVDQMLQGIETEGPIYLMIDQGFVKAGQIQRKGGVHIDGYWQPSLSTHGTSSNSHNHDPMPSSHSHSPPAPTHGHTPTIPSSHSHSPTYDSHNHEPIPTIPSSHSHAPVHHRHDPVIPTYDSHRHSPPPSHSHQPTTVPVKKIKFDSQEDIVQWPTESIILASDVQACRAWNGLFDHAVMEGGNCDHVNTQQLEQLMLKPNTVYVGNVTMLHESLPVSEDTMRTVIRLNVPGYNPPALN